MKESIEKKLEALDKKAKASHLKNDVKIAGSSSLHTIIKTKEQADFFMKLLKQQ